MELTQQDFDARVERAHAGVATDEDLRLIKQYKAEGFEQSNKDLEPAEVQNPPKDGGPADADTAGQPARSENTVAPDPTSGRDTGANKPGAPKNADDGLDKPSVSERRAAAGDDGTSVTRGFPTDRSTAAESNSGAKNSAQQTKGGNKSGR